MTPFLLDPYPETVATAFGATKTFAFPTELRVSLRGESVTANITLLSRGKPTQRIVRIYGTRSGIEVDFEAGIIRRIRNAQLPGAFGRIEVPLRQSAASASHAARTVLRFLRSDLHYFAGMRNLFTALYGAVRTGGPPPIRYDEIQRVANIMDLIFAQAHCGAVTKTGRTSGPRRRDGWKRMDHRRGRIPRHTRREETDIRRPSRPLPRQDESHSRGIAPVPTRGQRLDGESCRELVSKGTRGFNIASSLAGSAAALFSSNVIATRTLLAALRAHQCDRFVLVSSIAVYGTGHLRSTSVIDETCPLDPSPHLRDPYTFSKVVQEHVCWSARTDWNLPLVVIRPGNIYGPGRDVLT